MIPILVTVVEIPAINGNAPQTPHPIAPKKKFFGNSFLSKVLFLWIFLYTNGLKIIKTLAHLQKAKEMGGTCSTPPLAIIKFVAIKIGWTKSKI